MTQFEFGPDGSDSGEPAGAPPSDTVSQAIWIYDPARHTLYWSAGVAAVLGLDAPPAPLSRDAARGVDEMLAPILEHVPPPDRRALLASWNRWIDGNDAPPVSFPFVRSDASVAELSIDAVVVRDEDGTLAYVVGVLVDMTPIRSIENHLRQVRRLEALGRLASGVAHDFGNLLTIIQGNVNLLREQFDCDELDEIARATVAAADISRRLLDFSRETIASPGSVDLVEIVSDTCRLLERALGEDIELVVDLPDAELAVRADASEARQVLLNLAINARDAMPDGGRLEIAVRREGDDSAALIVSDTGLGFDEALADRLFEPFYTTKPEGRGTGLGLSTVRDIVSRHGGTIEVSSRPGAGARFVVRWPLARVASRAEADGAAAAPPAAGKTILVVEDDRAVLRVVRALLERHGFRVLAAARPSEALALYRDHADEIDAALVDVVMPEMSGPRLVERLLEHRPGLPVLYTTGHARELARGGRPVIPKPFTGAELVSSVAKLCP